MAWLEPLDMPRLPVDVYDANGLRICRHITGFDPETGQVESIVCGREGGRTVEDGEFCRRLEWFAAPLMWKVVGPVEVERLKRELWDLMEGGSQ